MILEMIGIIAFSISGYILASKAGFDIMGITLVAFITAFGGGIIRDSIVNIPPFVFIETYPILVSFITIIIAYFLKLHNQIKLSENTLFLVCDNIGLVVFAITGATIAISAGFNFGGVIALSLLTAIGGGVVRDIVLNEVPYVFTSEVYGTVAIIVGIFIWVIDTYFIITPILIIMVFIFSVLIRLLAIKYNLRLPKLVYK